MRGVLATSNIGKILEIRSWLPEIDWVTQSELNISEVPETGLSFIENALLKARNAAAKSNMMALADDSGLVIDALDGKPGLYSARYAGDHDFAKNIQQVLSEMVNVPSINRTARFYCALAIVRNADDACPMVTTGTWEGLILKNPIGSNGFGYDPIFMDPELGLSAAQISQTIKNKVSHRAKAMRNMQVLIAGMHN